MNRSEITRAILKHLPDKRHSILIGARQVGKTTVVKQIAASLIEKKEKAFYISFEQPEVLHAINEHPENIFNFTLHPNDLNAKQRLYIIIDEVQYANDPTNFLKLLFDKYAEKVKIIATGSSAFYINRDFKDSLAGRKKIFELYSLDFEEFLHFKKEDDLLHELLQLRKRAKYNSLQRPKLNKLFEEYLTYGGYPAVVLEKNKDVKVEMLQDLVNSYMRKDILEADLKDELKFFYMVRLLASQTGELVNQNELANTLKLSVGTIDNYLYLLRKCFHINLLRPKYSNVRKELTKMPKVYFNDLGLRNVLCKQFDRIDNRLDKGQLLENYVYTRLRKLYTPDNLFFWRTADGHEVDFVIEETLTKGLAYEVKFNEREYKPSKYKQFTGAYSKFPLKAISYVKEEKGAIEVIRL